MTKVYINPLPFRSLLSEAVTLPSTSLAHGYNVVGGGKIFHHPDPESWHEYFPSKKRSMLGLKTPRPSRVPHSRAFPTNRRPPYFDWGPIDVPDHGFHLGEKLHWRKLRLWERQPIPPSFLWSR